MHGRFGGRTVTMRRDGGVVRYSGDDFDVVFEPDDLAATVKGSADGPVDLTWLHIMDQILTAITAPRAINHVSAMLEHTTAR
jgi:hypothetical protein